MHACKESCKSVLKVCELITERTKASKKTSGRPEKKLILACPIDENP